MTSQPGLNHLDPDRVADAVPDHGLADRLAVGVPDHLGANCVANGVPGQLDPTRPPHRPAQQFGAPPLDSPRGVKCVADDEGSRSRSRYARIERIMTPLEFKVTADANTANMGVLTPSPLLARTPHVAVQPQRYAKPT